MSKRHNNKKVSTSKMKETKKETPDPDYVSSDEETLNPYYDDSSDEERDTQEIYRGDLDWINGKLQATQHKEILTPIPTKFTLNIDNLKLFFLLHEIGTRLLKSKEVNEKYYAQKREKLQRITELTEEDFDRTIQEGLFQSLGKFGLSKEKILQYLSSIKNDIYNSLLQEAQSTVKTESEEIIGRRVLSDECSLDEDYNIIDWLAHIRLINRSTKRTIKNKQDSKEEGIVEENKSSSSIKLVIPSTKQSISINYEINTTGSKKSLLPNIGSYEKVSKTIKNIGNKFNFSDSEICELIISLLNNTLERNEIYIKYFSHSSKKFNLLQEYLTNLTSLLFIEEAHRNPASLLTNYMLLDLIMAGEVSWKEALPQIKKDGKKKETIPGIIPMAPTGATSASMWLNERCSTSFKYKYDQREIKHQEMKSNDDPAYIKEVKNLITMEAELFKKWLELKQKNTNITSIEALEILITSCQAWYGVNLKNSFLENGYLERIIQILKGEIGSRIIGEYHLNLLPSDIKHYSFTQLKNLDSIVKYWPRLTLANIINAKLSFSEIFDLYNVYGEEIIDKFLTDRSLEVLKAINQFELNEILDLYLVIEESAKDDEDFKIEIDLFEELLISNQKQILQLMQYNLELEEIFNLYKDNTIEGIIEDSLAILKSNKDPESCIQINDLIEIYREEKWLFDYLVYDVNENKSFLIVEHGLERAIDKLREKYKVKENSKKMKIYDDGHRVDNIYDVYDEAARDSEDEDSESDHSQSTSSDSDISEDISISGESGSLDDQ